MRKKVAKKNRTVFYVKDWWVYQEAERRAEAKGITVGAELIDTARERYLLDKINIQKADIPIDAYMYNLLLLLAKRINRVADERENAKEGVKSKEVVKRKQFIRKKKPGGE
jgi:hypothetical protein